jgi:hypothetical protein
MPLALTDSELDILIRLAAPLCAGGRPAFLEDVARQLVGLPELGDGAVAWICTQCQRRYWQPPVVAGRR